MDEFSKKANLDKLDRQIEEFKSKKHKKISPTRLKVQNDGWRMVIELVTGMILGVSLGMALDYIIGSGPIFLIVFSLLGFMAGVKTMIATAKKMNETNN
jgi:ATP synthase protein I